MEVGLCRGHLGRAKEATRGLEARDTDGHVRSFLPRRHDKVAEIDDVIVKTAVRGILAVKVEGVKKQVVTILKIWAQYYGR